MKLWLRLTVTGALAVSLSGGFGFAFRAVAQGRGAAPAAPAQATVKKAGEVFKNVTTSTLKELTPDDFIAAMGVMTAALGYDCADCHVGAGSDKADFVIDTIPQKRTARRMVEMVAAINRTNFAGVQRVTCWTCHHGQEIPTTTIALDNLYAPPNMEDPDVVLPGVGQPSADQILDKYIQAVGGAQRLAGLTSFVATGASLGYGGFGGDGEFTIFAKAPNQRTTLISFKQHPERGDSVWAVDGRTGWIKTPRGLLSDYELIGEELDGARLEAQLAFPGQIKQALSNWRVGLRRAIEGKDYLIVQGSGPRGLLATLFFDPDTGLLRRMVRYGPSPVGRVPTQIDYMDYREVGGIKFPFEYQFSWLDGRYTAKIKDIRTNVPIDAARFGRPAAR
jgi:photosynthetic reaction center cytochrome c subunit